MPKLSDAIYGADDTGMANAVSSDALDVSTPGAAISNYWSGSPTSSAESKDGAETSRATKFVSGGGKQPGSVVVKSMGGGNDKRACVQGNHGKQGCNE